MYKIEILAVLLITIKGYSQGFLRTNGKLMVNEKGGKVILCGMGPGGWMLQEGYMFTLGSIGQQYRIKAIMKEPVGHHKTEQFYNDWLANHTTKTELIRWQPGALIQSVCLCIVICIHCL